MSRVISRNNFSFTHRTGIGTRNNSNCSVLSMREEKNKKNTKNTGIQCSSRGRSGLARLSFLIFIAVAVSGAAYLYQVNDLATKGYEMREVETKIAKLEKESKSMQIKEVELRSMYNLERATKDLDLVTAQNITYIEMDGPVAMK